MINNPFADAETIHQLEYMLKLAQAGQITSIAMVATDVRGTPQFGASNSAVSATTIGALEMLKARITDAANRQAGG